MIQLSPSFFARVCNANASDPDADSDRQNDPSYRIEHIRLGFEE